MERLHGDGDCWPTLLDASRSWAEPLEAQRTADWSSASQLLLRSSETPPAASGGEPLKTGAVDRPHVQAWSNYGPGAIFGPFSCLMRPAKLEEQALV